MDKSRRNNGVRVALIILCVVLALVFVVLSGIALYATYMYNRMEYVVGEYQTEIVETDERTIFL